MRHVYIAHYPSFTPLSRGRCALHPSQLACLAHHHIFCITSHSKLTKSVLSTLVTTECVEHLTTGSVLSTQNRQCFHHTTSTGVHNTQNLSVSTTLPAEVYLAHKISVFPPHYLKRCAWHTNFLVFLPHHPMEVCSHTASLVVLILLLEVCLAQSWKGGVSSTPPYGGVLCTQK